MEPIFLIIGCLAYGYPDEALRVAGLYVTFLMVRLKLRDWGRR